MNFKQLHYVLVLSQEGSFSRAADVLNISQPSLSQYIKKIETQVGMPLFVRLNGAVRLTDAGHAYIEAGRQILALEHQMENRLSDIADFRSGTVSLGISPYRSIHMIPGAFRAFHELYPDMRLVVHEKFERDLTVCALRGEFDLFIAALPVDGDAFAYEVIHKEEIVIAVHKSSALYAALDAAAERMPNRRYPAVDIRLTDGHDFAVPQETMRMYAVTQRVLKRYGVTVCPKIELSSVESLLSVVKSGVCAAFVPSGLAVSPADDVGFYSIRQDFDFRNVAALYRKDQYLSRPVRDLIDIFKALA